MSAEPTFIYECNMKQKLAMARGEITRLRRQAKDGEIRANALRGENERLRQALRASQ